MRCEKKSAKKIQYKWLIFLFVFVQFSYLGTFIDIYAILGIINVKFNKI